MFFVFVFVFAYFPGQLGNCIRVHGDWLPRHLPLPFSGGNAGAATALCAMVRMLYLGAVVCTQQILCAWFLLPDQYHTLVE